MEINTVSNLAHLAFDLIPEESGCVSEEGVIQLANKAMCQKLGSDTLVGRNLLAFQTDLSVWQWSRLWERMSGGEDISWVGLHIPQNGQPYPVKCRMVLLDEKLALYQATPYEAEALLGDWECGPDKEKVFQLSHQKLFQQIFDYSPMGLILSSAKGEIILINPTICSLLGYSEDELMDENTFSLTHPEDRTQHQKQFLQFLTTDWINPDSKRRYLRKDGTMLWARIRERIVRDEDGEFVYIITMVEDITTEIQAEYDRSVQYYQQRAIFDALPVIFYHKDDKNNILNCNTMAARSMGMEVQELIGCNAIHIHPDLADAYYQDDLEVIQSGKARLGLVEKYQTPYQTYWVKTDKVPYYEPDGTISGVLIFSMDISDLKQTQDELERKNVTLQKYIDSNLQLENFAYIASHDLREPLRTISNFSQLLERRYASQMDQDAQEFIHYISKGAKSLNRLINDLLLFSRVNSMEHKEELIDVKQFIGHVFHNLQASITEHKANIRIENMPETVTGSYTKLLQLSQNLLTNALKFHRPGQIPEIRIRCQEEQTRWVFSISDNGIGIPEKFQERIFGLFQKLHSGHQIEGSGIGLAICRRIVEQHNGEIWLESREGLGTTFYFSLARH